jgi:cytochrome c5
MKMQRPVQTMVVLSSLLGVSCESEIETTETATSQFCDDAPIVNYANFGESFINHQCQGCHASGLEERFDAPVEATFDNVDEVWEWREDILDRCDLETPTMPPRGGVTDDELIMLHWWLECATIGT